MTAQIKANSSKLFFLIIFGIFFTIGVVMATFFLLSQPSSAYTFSYTYVTEQSGVVVETTKNDCVLMNEEDVKLSNVEKAYIDYVGFKDLEAAALKIEQGCTIKKVPRLRFTGKEFLRY